MTAVSSIELPEQRTVLLIGDQPAQTRLIADRASKAGWRTIVCRNVKQARTMLDAEPTPQISAIILDEDTHPTGTYEAIADLKSTNPHVPILLISASASSQWSVHAIRAGASDYLVKPIAPERLLHALRTATCRAWPHEHELESFAEKFEGLVEFNGMIGADPAFRAALAQAALSARGHGNLLIEGETGTGKDMLAHAIHSASPRARMPLKVINARGMTDATLESALFGHKRGAFVGAFESKHGVLQACDGGTLVLDEVNRLPVSIQERLADTITKCRVRPMGATHTFVIDVRIIALSNGRLNEMMLKGTFNPKLYEALSSTRLALPPLRERIGDLPLIARHFLRSCQNSDDLRNLALTDSALSLLHRFDWPGNIRQLQAVLFRAAAFSSRHALTAEDFAHMAGLVNDENGPPTSRQISQDGGVMIFAEDGHLRTLIEVEADIIRLAIGHYRGRMTEVARRLRIGRSTLYRKMAELGIESASK